MVKKSNIGNPINILSVGYLVTPYLLPEGMKNNIVFTFTDKE